MLGKQVLDNYWKKLSWTIVFNQDKDNVGEISPIALLDGIWVAKKHFIAADIIFKKSIVYHQNFFKDTIICPQCHHRLCHDGGGLISTDVMTCNYKVWISQQERNNAIHFKYIWEMIMIKSQISY